MGPASRKPDWWLIVGGAVLVICGLLIFVVPWFFLEFLTVWAGIGFLVSGVASIASYLQARKTREDAGWGLFMGILDIIVGVMLIAHPFVFAAILPWMLGLVFIAFGVIEVAGMMPLARLVPETRTIAIISGVLSALVGIMFIVWPASLSIWVAAFALVRGITLIAIGCTTRG